MLPQSNEEELEGSKGTCNFCVKVDAPWSNGSERARMAVGRCQESQLHELRLQQGPQIRVHSVSRSGLHPYIR